MGLWMRYQPIPTMHTSKFDIDLKFGQAGEQWIKTLGQEGSIEIKTERGLWHETNNAAFEYSYKGEPSGIAITASTHWIHLFEKDGKILGGFIFNTNHLKDFLRKAWGARYSNGIRMVSGGDNKDSQIMLVPIALLHECYQNTPPSA
jgi:hypothetical protein